MLTDDDRVKILDFGLARVTDSSGDAKLPNSPTITGFVFVKTIAQDRARPSFSVVTDWFEEVRARMRTAVQP